MIILTGCLESNNDNNTENLIKQTNQEKILGSWSNTGKIENVTVKIIYNFYSNSSYFTGAIIENTSDYLYNIWGIYELNIDTIFFNSTYANVSNTALKYGFSEDYYKLIIYYDGYQNYIIYTRL